MRKFIIALFLVLTLSSQAFAAVPSVLGTKEATNFITSIGFGSPVVSMYYYMKGGLQSSVDPVGTVSRPSEAVWVDIVGSPPTPTIVTKPITAKVPESKFREIASEKNTDGSYKYPLVQAALNNGSWDVFDVTKDRPAGLPVGTIALTTAGEQLKITSVNLNSPNLGTYGPPCGTSVITDGFLIVNCPVYNATYPNKYRIERYYFTYDTTPAAVEPKTVPESNQALTGSPTGGTVTSSPLQAEIDEMLQDPEYVPQFTDDTTGLPYSPPTGIPSQAQLEAADAANTAAIAARNAAATAVGSATNALSGATSATTKAGDAYTASGGNLSTGVGGDPALYQAYLDAKGKSDGLQAALDKLNADIAAGEAALAGQAAAAAADEKEYGTFSAPAASDAYGDGDEFDVGERFNGFISDMKNTAVFSIPGQFLNNIPTGGSSTISFNGGRFGSHTFDFATLSDVFLALKAVILVCFGWYSIRIVTLKGGSG